MLKITSFLLLFFMVSFCYAQQNEKCSKVKILTNDRNALFEHGVWFSHAVYQPEGYFETEICGWEIEKLKISGLQYEIMIDDLSKFYVDRNLYPSKSSEKEITYDCGPLKTYPTPAHFSLGSMGGFYTYSEMIAQLDTMRALFPDLISLKTQIGLSLEGRPMYAVKISDRPDSSETEKQLLYTAVHHASEPAGLQQLIFFMYYLLENYQTNTEIKYLVDNLEMYFVPVVNPDGYVYNETTNPAGGGTWRKNRRPNGLFNGVDLNRNYGYAFGWDEIGSSSIGLHPWYRGTAAFSEPETQNLKLFIEAHDFLLDLNWHSWGNFLIYPWNYNAAFTADSTLYEQYCRYLSMESHFRYGTCAQTYGYNSNGDADDWGYGDLGAKNKIISLTAEIGSSADGFWPQITNIESLCKQSLSIDLRYAHLATPFALLNDLSPSYIHNTQVELPVQVYCLGLDVPADFTVSLTPISPEIISTSTPQLLVAMQSLEKRNTSVSIALASGIAQGTPISFSLDISNGLFIWRDTISKIFVAADTLLYDEANDLSNWNSTGWSVTTESSVSAPSCFTDSPNANYSLLQTSTLELKNAIDLTQASDAWLEFKARWNIEKCFDYLQVEASADNGATWQNLCGRWSSFGTSDQQPTQAIYDGSFPDWLEEEMPLSAFTGSSIKIRFVLKTNLTNNADGFYLDNIAVVSSDDFSSKGEPDRFSSFLVYPNPTKGNLFIELPPGFGEIICIKIFNSLGQLITVEYDVASVALSNLIPGIYFMKLSTEEGIFVRKFVKE